MRYRVTSLWENFTRRERGRGAGVGIGAGDAVATRERERASAARPSSDLRALWLQEAIDRALEQRVDVVVGMRERHWQPFSSTEGPRRRAKQDCVIATDRAPSSGAGWERGVRAMAQPRPRPGEILPRLTQLMNIPMDSPTRLVPTAL